MYPSSLHPITNTYTASNHLFFFDIHFNILLQHFSATFSSTFFFNILPLTFSPSCTFQISQLLQTPIYSRVRVVFKLAPNSENSSRTRTLLLIGARTHPDTLHHGREGGNLFVAEICFGFGELVRAWSNGARNGLAYIGQTDQPTAYRATTGTL